MASTIARTLFLALALSAAGCSSSSREPASKPAVEWRLELAGSGGLGYLVNPQDGRVYLVTPREVKFLGSPERADFAHELHQQAKLEAAKKSLRDADARGEWSEAAKAIRARAAAEKAARGEE